MKLTLLTSLILGLFLTPVIAQANRSAKKSAKQSSPQVSEKIVYKPDAELLREMRDKVRVVASKQNWAKFDRQRPINNPGKTRSVYVAQFKLENQPDAMLDVIVVYDSPIDKFYEIRGFEDFPWRPFSDFKWIGNDVLQFEQWVNPHSGGRYQVNLKTKKVVAAGYVRSN